MTAPFSQLDEWEMNATAFQGTVFIEESHTKKLESRADQNNRAPTRGNMSQDLMSFWGYKFETLALMPTPWPETSREYLEAREDEVVSNYAQYCSIVRTGFGKSKVVIGGEVDAVEAFKPEDIKEPVKWVELKTTAEVTNDRDLVKYERKLLKFWAQSFLLGVPKIVVGYRSQQGILQRLEEIETQTIPDRVARGKRLWDGQTCINFTSSFLDWIKAVIVGEGTWRIQKRQKVPYLEVFKVEETGTGDILSDRFLAWRRSGDVGEQQVQRSATSLVAAQTVNGVMSSEDQVVKPAIGSTVPEQTPGPDAMGLEDRRKALLTALQGAVASEPP
jgi:RAT1-interacting protein